MAAVSNGIPINLYNLQGLLANGGDPDATLPLGSIENTASRGMHMLAAFVAPLDYYHDQWTGRVTDAVRSATNDWRVATAGYDQRYYVIDALTAATTTLRVARESAAAGKQDWDTSVHGQALDGYFLRASLNTALATVDARAAAMKIGGDLYITDAADLNRITDENIKLDADQGMASARTIGDAVQFTSEVRRLQDGQRQLIASEAELTAQQRVDKAQRDQRNDAFLGQAIGFGLSLFG